MLKSELAERFFGVEVRTMMRWIKSNENLQKELKEVGYTSKNRVLTPKQIALIRKYYG